MQKEFDLVKILSDTAKVEEMNTIKSAARKEMLDEVVTFINNEHLKVYKDESEEESEKIGSYLTGGFFYE